MNLLNITDTPCICRRIYYCWYVYLFYDAFV